MKIIFLVRRFYPKIGGVEKHAMAISKELVKRGHTVIIITENCDSLSAKEEVNGIRILRINAGNDNWFKKFRIWKELWVNRKLLVDADIIHCHDIFFWYLPFRFLYPSKKIYTTFHGHETRFPPEKKAIFIRKISEKLSKGNICIGEYIKKWYGTNPNFVLYGGVNKLQNSKFQFKIQNFNSKFKIIFIGRLNEDIGIMKYSKSLELLKTEKFKFEFEAYGEGSLSKKLENYGKIFGFRKDIDKIIQNANVIFASSYLIMLEALAQKKIVISTFENQLKEDYLRMSQFSKYVYICNSPNEIVKVIESIKNIPWKSKTIIEDGYKWAGEQTWEKVTDIYLKLWKI